MSDADREALRARARDFVAGAAFVRHYEKLHVPARQWFIGQFLRCLTILGLPGGLRALLNSGNQAFAAEKLMEGYRRLIDSGRIVQAFVVLNSGELDGNPKACAPALVIASLAGTDDGDAIARVLFIDISTRIHLGKLTGPADKAVQTMISDDEYRAFRKRPLPANFTTGRAAHFLDVKIDNELLRGHSLYKASEFYFLVDPSPRGLILEVPQVDHAVPSPQATGA
jgi:hypothetical protein